MGIVHRFVPPRGDTAVVVPLVVGAGEFLEVAGDPVRLAERRGQGDDAGELGELAEEDRLGLVVQQLGDEGVLAAHAVGLGVAGHVAGAGVGVLHVVDGVLVVLLAELLTVDGERGVGGEAGEGVPDGVGPDPVDEVAELDDVAGALGHARPAHVDELADHDLDVEVGVVAGAGGERPEAVDVAVVVRAEEVDLLGEAAVLLGQVVGGVRGEVGGLAVRADEDAVLVV